MKKGTAVLGLLVLITSFTKGQENINNLNVVTETNLDQGKKREVVVKKYMIERLKNYESKDGYVSLFDLYRELSAEERIEFLREYRISDLNTMSLAEIKEKALQNITDKNLSEDEIEKLCMLKKSIKDYFKNGSTAQAIY